MKVAANKARDEGSPLGLIHHCAGGLDVHPVVRANERLVVEAHRLLALARVDDADIPSATCRLRDETRA